MLKLFLWLRYLGKKKVVLLSVAAVALSSSLLIVVASLFTGFINTLERSAEDALGEVIIEPWGHITDYSKLIERLEQTSVVEAATGRLMGQGLVHLGRGEVRAVAIWGIEPEKQDKVTTFEQSLIKGSESEQQVSDNESRGDVVEGFVGIGVLAKPDEQTDEYDFDAVRKMIGTEVVVTTGGMVSSKQESRFRRSTMRVRIAGVIYTGVFFRDNNIYLSIDRVQEAVWPDEENNIADQIAIKLNKGADIDSALAQIRGVWSSFASQELGWSQYQIGQTRIETAKQMQGRYVVEIRKQMGVLLLIFGVVSLSAVLLVFCIFYMIVETKRKDVAIMKSCGATSATVSTIFIGFGCFIGITGAGIGTALGYLITRNINTIEGWIRVMFGLKLWKASVYMFSRIPTEVDWPAVVWIVLSATAGAAIGATIPALSAAMTRPVKVLRYE
jgi:lipoprotein-releasing system permease protein